jgi:hypothetical protein
VVVHTDDVAWHLDPIAWDHALVDGVLDPWRRGEDVAVRPVRADLGLGLTR